MRKDVGDAILAGGAHAPRAQAAYRANRERLAELQVAVEEHQVVIINDGGYPDQGERRRMAIERERLQISRRSRVGFETEAAAEGSCRRASGVCGAYSYSYSYRVNSIWVKK